MTVLDLILIVGMLALCLYYVVMHHTYRAILDDLHGYHPDDMGTIYVFRGKGEPFWYVKIGKAKDVVARMRSHRTANPHGVKILAVCEVADMASAERNIHRRFATLRRNGEWFLLTPRLWNYIRCLKNPHTTREVQKKLEWS